MSEVSFRDARMEEADALSAIAFRSKQHWGYSPEFMQACRDELTYTKRDLEARETTFVVADSAGNIAGFYALVVGDADCAELDAMFVDPGFIGRGIGMALMQHALKTARSLNVKKIVIQSDPNAAEFYQSIGAKPCGERESASIPGRMLPLLEIAL